MLSAFIAQHISEFLLTNTWDERGDRLEDMLMAAMMLYVFWIAYTRFKHPGVYRPLAIRFLVLSIISLPGMLYDTFVANDGVWRFYPLFYCIGSVVFTDSLLRMNSSTAVSAQLPNWGLTEREAEVAELVQQGQSNKQIADRLNISTNTVKTHLSAIFAKSGFHSRFELIAAGNRNLVSNSRISTAKHVPGPYHPKG